MELGERQKSQPKNRKSPFGDSRDWDGFQAVRDIVSVTVECVILSQADINAIGHGITIAVVITDATATNAGYRLVRIGGTAVAIVDSAVTV